MLKRTMKAIVDFCIIPLGNGTSVSREVAACQAVFAASNVKYELHANGTNLEGDWDEVMAVVKACHEKVFEMGAVRIHS
eukprot:Ihof_evm3s387 gene=Ihof_evmTU3s387